MTKHLIILLLSLFCVTLTPAQDVPPKPKRVYAWKADSKWLKGAKAFEASKMKAAPILQSVDLSKWMIPDDDQGQWGRCTGYGTRRAYSAALGKQTGKAPMLSANFAYWNGRAAEGTTGEDSGAQIKDVIQGLITYGIPLAALCPDNSSPLEKPSPFAFLDALTRQVTHTYKVDAAHGQDLERAMSSGFPVVFGIVLRESFESLDAVHYNYVPSGQVMGGHCMTAYKYSIPDGTIWIWNQWGTSWGKNGKCCMNLKLFHKLAQDCWIIDAIEATTR
jgi:hypothetical protein